MPHLPDQSSASPPSILTRIAAAVVFVIGLGLSIFVSVILFGVILVGGLILGAVVWWKTRDLRKALRQAQGQFQDEARARQGQSRPEDFRRPRSDPDSHTFEGEYTVEPDENRSSKS